MGRGGRGSGVGRGGRDCSTPRESRKAYRSNSRSSSSRDICRRASFGSTSSTASRASAVSRRILTLRRFLSRWIAAPSCFSRSSSASYTPSSSAGLSRSRSARRSPFALLSFAFAADHLSPQESSAAARRSARLSHSGSRSIRSIARVRPLSFSSPRL